MKIFCMIAFLSVLNNVTYSQNAINKISLKKQCNYDTIRRASFVVSEYKNNPSNFKYIYNLNSEIDDKNVNLYINSDACSFMTYNYKKIAFKDKDNDYYKIKNIIVNNKEYNNILNNCFELNENIILYENSCIINKKNNTLSSTQPTATTATATTTTTTTTTNTTTNTTTTTTTTTHTTTPTTTTHTTTQTTSSTQNITTTHTTTQTMSSTQNTTTTTPTTTQNTNTTTPTTTQNTTTTTTHTTSPTTQNTTITTNNTTFTSKNTPPITENNSVQMKNDSQIQESKLNENKNEDYGVMIGSIIGGFCFIAIIALVVKSQNKNKNTENETIFFNSEYDTNAQYKNEFNTVDYEKPISVIKEHVYYSQEKTYDKEQQEVYDQAQEQTYSEELLNGDYMEVHNNTTHEEQKNESENEYENDYENPKYMNNKVRKDTNLHEHINDFATKNNINIEND